MHGRSTQPKIYDYGRTWLSNIDRTVNQGTQPSAWHCIRSATCILLHPYRIETSHFAPSHCSSLRFWQNQIIFRFPVNLEWTYIRFDSTGIVWYAWCLFSFDRKYVCIRCNGVEFFPDVQRTVHAKGIEEEKRNGRMLSPRYTSLNFYDRHKSRRSGAIKGEVPMLKRLRLDDFFRHQNKKKIVGKCSVTCIGWIDDEKHTKNE